MNKNLNRAINVIKKGGLAVFPTDTAFGIGCRIDNKVSVRRLFEVRKRPKEKAVPVLVSSIKMAEEYIDEISPEVRILMKKYWPGGLTIIMKSKPKKILNIVLGGGLTVGLRIPGNVTARKLIEGVGVPIIGSSANFAGGKTPCKGSEVDSDLVSKVDFFLPGRCKIKKSSTVIDVTTKPWKILREGAVKIK
jgi:L-threonylcarbamoyladenylate synthase